MSIVYFVVLAVVLAVVLLFFLFLCLIELIPDYEREVLIRMAELNGLKRKRFESNKKFRNRIVSAIERTRGKTW